MKIILFCHPAFSSSESMPRFAGNLQRAYLARGYEVDVWQPQELCRRWFRRGAIGKWLGYVDQYILFPRWVKKGLRRVPMDTLFVFCDQALGPWVPLVAERPHVIHCHDFLALQSALGEHPQNPVKWSGRIYQRFIRNGFRAGKNFISVSQHSRKELGKYLLTEPTLSEVVLQGLTYEYAPLSDAEALDELKALAAPVGAQRMLVNVGGNHWYKNREGVLHIYAQYCRQCADPVPLWMVGESPTEAMRRLAGAIDPKGKVYFLSGTTNRQLQAIYSLAKAMLFPSLAEGFGLPILEAMACGCPVLTTGAAPMTEVGGESVTYIPRMPFVDGIEQWATAAAHTLIALLNAPEAEQQRRKAAGIEQAARFTSDHVIASYEHIYRQVIVPFRKPG